MSNVVDNETGRPLAEGKVSHVLEWWGRKIGLVSEALTLKMEIYCTGESFSGILRTIIFFSWKHCLLTRERRDFFFFYPRVTRSPKREKLEGKSFASSPPPLYCSTFFSFPETAICEIGVSFPNKGKEKGHGYTRTRNLTILPCQTFFFQRGGREKGTAKFERARFRN